jgi:predicted DNA-binding protein with PD1-like motif
MKTKLLHDADGKRTFAIILETDDEAVSCLEAFAEKQSIGGSQVTAIGALSRATLAYFDWQTKAYQRINVGEQVEVASLIGDIAVGPDNRPSVHIHVVLGKRDGTALAGHLQEAHVRPTLEIIVTEMPVHLHKCKDKDSGLALIKL